jgi:hypothetical protein
MLKVLDTRMQKKRKEPHLSTGLAPFRLCVNLCPSADPQIKMQVRNSNYYRIPRSRVKTQITEDPELDFIELRIAGGRVLDRVRVFLRKSGAPISCGLNSF